MGCIDMIRTNKVHSFADVSMAYDVVESEPTTEIITVGSAAKFISEAVLGKIQTNAWLSGNEKTVDLIALLFPNAASQLADMQIDDRFWATLIVTLFFAAICFAGFTVIMEKRTDRGR